MDALSHQRVKTVVFSSVAGLSLLITGVLTLRIRPEPAPGEIESRVRRAMSHWEAGITERIETLKRRAGTLGRMMSESRLDHEDLREGEALIREQRGVVVDHFGEIYHFKRGGVAVGEWEILHHRDILFFLSREADSVYYVARLFNLRDRRALAWVPLPVLTGGLKYFDHPAGPGEDGFGFEPANELFRFSQAVASLRRQVLVQLKLSTGEIEDFQKGRRRRVLYLGACVLVLILIVYFLLSRIPRRPAWIALFTGLALVLLFPVVRGWGGADLYLTVAGPPLFSIFEVILLLGSLLAVIRAAQLFWPRALNQPLLCTGIFTAGMVVYPRLAGALLTALDFDYSRFRGDPRYLALLLCLLLLHLLPLSFVAVARRFQRRTWRVLLAIVPGLVGWIAVLFSWDDALTVVLFWSLYLTVQVLERKGTRWLAQVVLISLSVFHTISAGAMAEKQRFISGNLKNIFLNQRNYAKFIANEITHEINSSSSDFAEFFSGDPGARLEEIWRNSLASREDIASGIFVLDPDNRVIGYFSYMIPYLRAEFDILFPFWAVGDATAEVYGKGVSLGMASISVFKEGRLLGSIVVQVVDSPELILRRQEQQNIFTLDRRIGGEDLSYLRLNENNQVIENPANINLKNIAGILGHDGEWITFRFMEIPFQGYIFRQDQGRTIIFFPRRTLVQQVAEGIRIFLVFLLATALIRLRRGGWSRWRSLYYSFSIRVFSILILISISTAVFFSIFSFDFFAQSRAQQNRWMVLENGRTAENILNNILEDSSALQQDQVFLLSATINKDVNVYERGELLFASDYRKIIDAEIPVFLHSRIIDLLEEKKEPYVFGENDAGSDLYFRMLNYIIHIEFPAPGRDMASLPGRYSDFIIVLFMVLLLAGISSAFFLRKKIIAPIQELNRGMEEVERGNLYRLRDTPDEIELKNLYLGFNAMVGGIEEQKKNISEISRMKTLLKLGRRVAHEVKNPLTPIKLSAEQIRRSLRDKRHDYEKVIEQSVRYIIDETDHLKRVAYGFLDFSRLEEIRPERFSLPEVIDEEVNSFRSIYGEHGFQVTYGTKDLDVEWDRLKFKQALKNIMINAVEALGDKSGRIELDVRREGEVVTVGVSDNGVGLEKRELALIFNEDYSTKEVGTGLGLFIVKRIVDLHGGNIRVESEKNRGTTVTLEMPRHATQTRKT